MTRWWTAVGWALTGQKLEPVPDDQPPEAARIAEWLRDRGVVSQTLTDGRASCVARGVPWPHPAPADLHVPPAQLSALVAEVRRVVEAAPTRVRHRPAGPPSAADRRLLDEVPPHNGT